MDTCLLLDASNKRISWNQYSVVHNRLNRHGSGDHRPVSFDYSLFYSASYDSNINGGNSKKDITINNLTLIGNEKNLATSDIKATLGVAVHSTAVLYPHSWFDFSITEQLSKGLGSGYSGEQTHISIGFNLHGSSSYYYNFGVDYYSDKRHLSETENTIINSEVSYIRPQNRNIYEASLHIENDISSGSYVLGADYEYVNTLGKSIKSSVSKQMDSTTLKSISNHLELNFGFPFYSQPVYVMLALGRYSPTLFMGANKTLHINSMSLSTRIDSLKNLTLRRDVNKSNIDFFNKDSISIELSSYFN